MEYDEKQLKLIYVLRGCVWNEIKKIVEILWYLVLMFISVTNTLTGLCFSPIGQNRDVNLIYQE